MIRNNLKYKGYSCYVDVCLYPQAPNKNIALRLMDMEDDGVVAVMTVNPNEEFPQTHTCIKDYSENEGILAFAIENEIIIEDDTAHPILLPSGIIVDCFRVADDIYNKYLEVLKDYKNEMGEF